jgi:hypothetical protein
LLKWCLLPPHLVQIYTHSHTHWWHWWPQTLNIIAGPANVCQAKCTPVTSMIAHLHLIDVDIHMYMYVLPIFLHMYTRTQELFLQPMKVDECDHKGWTNCIINIVPWLEILTNQIPPYEVDRSLIKPCIYVQGLITASGHTV